MWRKWGICIILFLGITGCGLFRKEPLLVEEIEVTENSSPFAREKKTKEEKKRKRVAETRKESTKKLTSIRNEIVQTARSYLGTPYRYGGTGKDGIDCSGLTFQCYKKVGIELPRISSEQAKVGVEISISEAQPGDLIYFWTGKRNVISHVGIVSKVENGEIYFIHAATSEGVREDQLSSPYWKTHFLGIRRVVKDQ